MSIGSNPDWLIYEGVYYELDEKRDLMGSFFKKHPDKWKKIMALCDLRSTANRYTEGIYSIKNNELVLKDFLVNTGLEFKSVKNILTNIFKPNIKIKWYNGILECDGDEVYLIIQIEKGKILQKEIMNKEERSYFYDEWTEEFLSADHDDKYFFFKKMVELDMIMNIKHEKLKKLLGKSELSTLDISVPFVNKLFEIYYPSSDDYQNTSTDQIAEFKMNNKGFDLEMRNKFKDNAAGYLLAHYDVGKKYLPEPFMKRKN